jgi:serine protease Do
VNDCQKQRGHEVAMSDPQRKQKDCPISICKWSLYLAMNEPPIWSRRIRSRGRWAAAALVIVVLTAFGWVIAPSRYGAVDEKTTSGAESPTEMVVTGPVPGGPAAPNPPDGLSLAAAEKGHSGPEPAGQTNPTVSPRPEDLPVLERRVQAIYEKVKASTVAVFTVSGQFGSGTVVTREGHVLTHAHHSYKPGTEIQVVFEDGRKVRGKLLGVHRRWDLSLAKLDGDGPWPAVPLGSPDGTRAGDICFMMSSPTYGYYRVGRPPLLRLGRLLGVSGQHLVTTCTSGGGDSGGALLNLDGELIGVTDINPAQEGVGHVSVGTYLKIRNELLESKFVDAKRIDRSMWTLKGVGPFKDVQGLSGFAEPVRRSVVMVLSGERLVAQGTVVGAEGWVLTKASDLSDPIVCQFADGRRLEASVAGKSWEHNLALLKVAAKGLPAVVWSERPLKAGMIVASVGPAPIVSINATLKQPVFGAVGSSVLIDVPLQRVQFPFDDVHAPKAAIAGVQITKAWTIDPLDPSKTIPVVRDGDVVTHVQGIPVPTVEEYKRVAKRFLDSREALDGKKATLTIRREGKMLEVDVIPESAVFNLGFNYPDDYGGRQSGFPSVFLHDAWVSRGCHGGPVIDVDGKVIGINLATGVSRGNGSGVMYAVPANVARQLSTKLRSAPAD